MRFPYGTGNSEEGVVIIMPQSYEYVLNVYILDILVCRSIRSRMNNSTSVYIVLMSGPHGDG